MLRNYFTLAWRTLLRSRLYSLINIFGLTVGISSCLVIYLIVSFELSFNRDNADADRIYRIYSAFSGQFEGTNRGISTGAARWASEQISGLEAAAPFQTFSSKVSVPGKGDSKTFEGEDRIAITPPSFFSVVSHYEWIRGTPGQALIEPRSVVLTLDQAKKYFATDVPEEIMGRELHYSDSLILTVSGIVRPLSDHSDFEFSEFISFSTIEATFLKERISLNDWESTNSSSQLFVKLLPGTKDETFTQQLTKLNQEYQSHNKETDWKLSHNPQPLSDLHFNAELGIFDHSRPAAHLSTMTTLSVVAVILLLLASINFVNLETARAVKRAKEVGVRKVLGSSKRQLMGHFLAQSLVMSMVAVVLSIPMAELGLIFFSDFIPQGVELSLSNVMTVLFLASVVLVVGILSGIYPAFVLSSFRPVQALKNQGYINSTNSRSAYMRKGLIVFQFAAAQLLIIGTLVIVSQINFMLNKDLGFSKEAIIHIYTPGSEKEEKRFTLKGELEQIPEVVQLSMCQAPPATNGFSTNGLVYKKGLEEIKVSVMRKFGDPNYLPLYGISLVAGRNISANHPKEIVINEAYAKELGLTPEEALGQEVSQNKNVYNIVGVVKDFHVFSLHAPFKPIYINGFEENLYSFSIKLPVPENGAENFTAAIAKIELAWNKVYPDKKFKYEFVDETIRNFYQTEQKMSKLSGTAMTIAIIISCLGLFGLASYTSLQRSKEVGIRKVLGATAQNILVLLSGDFLRLVMIAFVVATPIAWWGAGKFLDEYTFHVDLGMPLFVYAGLGSLALAFLTVSYQALKSAWMNPVDSLRTE